MVTVLGELAEILGNVRHGIMKVNWRPNCRGKLKVPRRFAPNPGPAGVSLEMTRTDTI
ncbi:hypothetical protein SBDP1_1520032 [Syntrophobacter sp. SbD1]|nr:hypothetical protein SBDP1_1520032 [Syntrophobacter sp. SbD1]